MSKIYIIFIFLLFIKNSYSAEIVHFGEVINFTAPEGYCEFSNTVMGIKQLRFMQKSMGEQQPIPKLIFKKCNSTEEILPALTVMVSRLLVDTRETQKHMNKEFTSMFLTGETDELYDIVEDIYKKNMKDAFNIKAQIKYDKKIIRYKGSEAFVTLGKVKMRIGNHDEELISMAASVFMSPFLVLIYLQDKYSDNFDNNLDYELSNLIKSIGKLRESYE